MSDPGTQGLGDLLALLTGASPLAGVGRSVDQFKRGVNEFLSAVENFNRTMEQLNGVATRVNALLDEVEEPVKTLMPQVTRTLRAADMMVEQLTGPVEKVAPGLSRLAEALASPAIGRLPGELGDVVDGLTDLVRRLQPLTQIAETAGSMFGFRPLAALRSGVGRPTDPATGRSTATPSVAPPTATKKKAATATKAVDTTTKAAKKAATSTARTTAGDKKAASKKAASKKAASKKAASKKAGARQP